jgi:hypothetical protein
MPLPRFRLRTLMIVVAVAAVICLYLALVDSADWIGGFPIQVDLRDQAGRTIVAVAAETCQFRQDAELLLAHPDSPEFNLVSVPWVQGQPFTIYVVCMGCTRWGRERAYHQREFLVMRVEYADGSRRLVSAAIPDGRVKRRVTVLVP